MKYDTLTKIVEQLEYCGYTTKDRLHDLKDNIAFIRLKEIAAKESVPAGTVVYQLRETIFGQWQTDYPLNIKPPVKYLVKTNKGVNVARYVAYGKWFSVYKTGYELKTVKGWMPLPKS